jgi:LysM repeat protein
MDQLTSKLSKSKLPTAEEGMVQTADVFRAGKHDGKLVYHSVLPGETLPKIALKYNVVPDSVLAWNQLWGYSMTPGQILKVYVPLSIPTDYYANAMASGLFTEVDAGLGKTGAVSYKVVPAEPQLDTLAVTPMQPLRTNDHVARAGKSTTASVHYGCTFDTDFLYYRVLPGESLWDISHKFTGVTVGELRTWNEFGHSISLEPGQLIRVKY